MMKLSTDTFDWSMLFTHIAEFVRVDEHLRLKTLALDKITPESPGWTYLAGIQVTEHKRLLINMRCFLLYQAKEVWGNASTMFSPVEYQTIKNHQDILYQIYKTMPGYDVVTNGDQFWFLMQALDDKEATTMFFRFLVEKCYPKENGRFISGIKRVEIVDHIISNCTFTLV